MKITKFFHSCLLIEDEAETYLIDPGDYTYDAKVLDLTTIDHIDYVLITHEHQDHMHIPFIKEILSVFGSAKIITNSDAQAILEDAGITVAAEVPHHIRTQLIPHEKVFAGQPPTNMLFTINDKLTHPGDSHHFETTTPILALPVQAPWGTLTAAVALAEELRPKIIIPIHDWHWRDEAREAFYNRLRTYFEPKGIEFIGLPTGEGVVIS